VTETIDWAISTIGPEEGFRPLSRLLPGLQWVRVARHTTEASGGVVANFVAPLNTTVLRWKGHLRTYVPLLRGVEDADLGGPVQYDQVEREWVPEGFTWVNCYLLVVPYAEPTASVIKMLPANVMVKFQTGTATSLVTT